MVRCGTHNIAGYQPVQNCTGNYRDVVFCYIFATSRHSTITMAFYRLQSFDAIGIASESPNRLHKIALITTLFDYLP